MTTFTLSQSYNPSNQLKPQRIQDPLAPAPAVKIQQSAGKTEKENTSANTAFYAQEIERLCYMNTLITAQLATALEEKKIITKLINQAERREEKPPETPTEKRLRRSASQIERKYKCSEQDCEKSYGSEGSLYQHIRLKHPKVNSHDPPLMLDPA